MTNKKTKLPGLVVILSSPSGTGKTTICQRLISHHDDFLFSISATTRPARGKEKNGVDYHFLANEKFDEMVVTNQLAEWAYVFEHRYGTPRNELQKALANNKVLLCDIDVQGGMALKEKFPLAVTIFLIPPSFKELKRRLFTRNTDDPHQKMVRLETATRELQYWHKYDYLILNENLKKATNQVDMIIAAERHRAIRLNQRQYWNSSQAGILGL
jgi:guanylate kinase